MIELNFNFYTKGNNLVALRQKKVHRLCCQKNMDLNSSVKH